MPKVVDHEERRRRIAAAVRRIAADQGLEAVSLGQVALAAGISKGQVQHYFPSKDAMLRHALRSLREHVDRQVDAPTDLRGLLLALLPLEEGSRTEALVANAFLWRALKDDDIAEQFRVGYQQLHAGLVELIAAEQASGSLSAALDPSSEADLLVALTTGLADTILLGHRSAQEAIALIDHHLKRLA